MTNCFKQCALASCASVLVAGCAAHQQFAPEYRLSSTAPAEVTGASMMQRGRAQLDAGLDALAIESFRGEIRQNPESADAYNGLAVAYGRIGRNDLAQRYFETALAKDPSNAKAQSNLAQLTGDYPAKMQMAELAVPKVAVEPVAIAVAVDQDIIGGILDRLDLPVVTQAEIPVMSVAASPLPEVLGSKGILSARFAIAPAELAKTHSVQTARYAKLPENPAPPPSRPEPALLPAVLASEYRGSGTRLERVSLGEVRLITRSEKPVTMAAEKTEFSSFGDRLAGWLPQTIATEQSGRHLKIQTGAVILAAVERAEQEQVLPSMESKQTGLPEFAYIFFDDETVRDG
jgi:hypothetical protein